MKQLPLLAETKISVHGAVSDESKGTATLEQILLGIFRHRQLILTAFSYFIDRKQVQGLKQIKQIALSISASHCQNSNQKVLFRF